MKTHCKRGHDLSKTRNKHRQCSECIDTWRFRNPERRKEILRGSARRSRMKNLYHLTQEEYDRMYAAQGGLCILPSCEDPATDIDHCHLRGFTRGLMCNRHNLALGLFNDNPTLLREAAEYLEKFNGK